MCWEGDEKLTTDAGLLLQLQRPPTMAPSSAKAKRLPNFKLLHEREQARVERFKVRARVLAALSRTNVLCSAGRSATPRSHGRDMRGRDGHARPARCSRRSAHDAMHLYCCRLLGREPAQAHAAAALQTADE